MNEDMQINFIPGDKVVLVETGDYIPEGLLEHGRNFEVDYTSADGYVYLKHLPAGYNGGWDPSRFKLEEEDSKHVEEEKVSMSATLSEVDFAKKGLIEQLNHLNSLVEEAVHSPVNATQGTVDELSGVIEKAYGIRSLIQAKYATFLIDYDNALDNVDLTLVDLQDHRDNLKDQVSIGTITLTPCQFSQVIRSGKITGLSGIYTAPQGEEQKLFLNNSDKIRPPMDVMLSTGGTLTITDVELVLKTGKHLDFDDIKAILPEGC